MQQDPFPLNLLPIDNELRRSPRAYVSISVSLEIGGTIIRGAECRNISRGGMFISTPHLLPAGTSGIVTLTQRCGDNRYSFSAEFMVVRVEPNSPRGAGVGVYFKRISKEDQRNLIQIVEFHLSITIKEKLRILPERVQDLQFKIAATAHELEQAFRLVHDSYVREGYMDPHPSGLRLSIFNALPHSTVFIGCRGNEVLLATTLFPDSFLGLPMDTLYKKELQQVRDEGRFIAEVGAFAVAPDFRDNNPTVLLYLQKMLYHYTVSYLKIDDFVVTINPKHRLFYQHLIMFSQIGEERQYENVKDSPAIAMRSDLRTFLERVEEQYRDLPPEKNLHSFVCSPLGDSLSLPVGKKPVSVWNASMIHYFFDEQTDTFSRTDKKTVNLIRALYN